MSLLYWLANSTPNTVASLWSSYASFVEHGSKLQQAKKYNNVVNPPLLTGPDGDKVLSLVYFPELHVLTGIVGKLVKEFEKQVFPTQEEGKKFLDIWMASPLVNVSRTEYHGSANFVGDMAKKLLKKLDHLESPVMELDPVAVSKAVPFIETLRLFEVVTVSCFGQYVEPGYSDKIERFSIAYRSLGISTPLKVNIKMINTIVLQNIQFNVSICFNF